MTDDPAYGTDGPAGPDVVRRDKLTVAVQATSDAYRESHSSHLFVPSGLRRSAYRLSEPFTGPGFV
jgi:hypothetical protein